MANPLVKHRAIFQNESLISLLILSGFSLYFSYDLITFQRVIGSFDINEVYFPVRNWFGARLLEGEFPIWIPYWGIGHPFELWTTIPVDIYSIFEAVLGPKYHVIQGLQAWLMLGTGYFCFRKLGFESIVAAVGALTFFMMPNVLFIFFSFHTTNAFISYILLFTWILKFAKSNDTKYLYFIFLTVVFSMFGTRMESWFYQTSFCMVFCFFALRIYNPGNIKETLKSTGKVWFAYIMGIFAHAWQLNILLRIFKGSGRSLEHSLLNLFSLDFYNLFWHVGIKTSVLLAIFVAAAPLYFFINRRSRLPIVFLFLGLFILIIFQTHELVIFKIFLNSPYLWGAVLGLIVSLSLEPQNYRRHAKTALLFLLFVFYWSRPGRGDLQEVLILSRAGVSFKVLMSFLVWLGCSQYQKSRLVKLAYWSVFGVLVMREQGQFLLSHLMGMFWVPQRDNYLIALPLAIIACLGLSKFPSPGRGVVRTLSLVALAWSAFTSYYPVNHMLISNPPPAFAEYSGEPHISSEVIGDLKDSPTWRFHSNKKQRLNIFSRSGMLVYAQANYVGMFSSVVSKNFLDWCLYRQYKIPIGTFKGVYPSEMTPASKARLPKASALYWEALQPVPPMEENVLKLLGVKHVIFDHFGGGYSNSYDLSFGFMNVKEIRGYKVGEIENPMPRAFTISDPHAILKPLLVSDHTPIPKTDDREIIVKDKSFTYEPAEISDYQREYVEIKTESEQPSILVLSDLYHPFWRAKIDGIMTPILPAFTLFRGVEIPPGSHTVEFFCRVPYFYVGFAVSGFILAGAGIMFFRRRASSN